MFGLIASSKPQIFFRRLPGLFHESVEQYHSTSLIDIEENARDTVLRQIGSDLVDSVTQWPANGHSDWPTELYGLDILTNAFSIVG